MFRVVLSLLLLLGLVNRSVADSSITANVTGEKQLKSIDVRKDVWPILRERCLHCHGPKRADGDLRLDQKPAIDAGGHTGNPLLGTIESSELLRRIESANDAYRMPKGEYPLSLAQIEIFRRWIKQGAAWPASEVISMEEPITFDTVLSSDGWSRLLIPIGELNRELNILYWPALLFLLMIAFFERRKRRHVVSLKLTKEETFLDRFEKHFGLPLYLNGILFFLLAGTIRHQRMTIDTIKQKLVAIENESHQKGLNANELERSRFQVPTPFRPRHPPRMGGTYYRGNDERSEKLFNGGYYRTAKMNVGLFDAFDRQLQWNDSVEDGDLYIHLTIEKAPLATRELFREETMTSTFLSRQTSFDRSIATRDIDSNRAYMKSLVPNESWHAQYRIASVTAVGDERFAGLIYVCPGADNPHYGIQYDIHLKDGTIIETSEVWMGAILLVGGIVLPPDGRLPLHEWFDFLPIPEIAGQNSDDPELLGIKNPD